MEVNLDKAAAGVVVRSLSGIAADDVLIRVGLV
jgi:hypothetical protein